MHAVPVTNHVLSKGQTSSNAMRKYKYVDTVINNLRDDHNDTATITSTFDTSPEATAIPSLSSMKGLSQEPYRFVVDTDSIPYVIDTGANHIIVMMREIYVI